MDTKLLNKLVRYTSMPFEFFVLIGGGAWFGSWLDKILHTSPWLAFVFAILGFGSALYHTLKSIKKI